MKYIDIDVLKSDLEWQMDRTNPNWSWTNEAACYDLLEYLDDLPVVDPVKHGEWIFKEAYDELNILAKRYMICSECGFYWSERRHSEVFKHCPNCGARMDGEANA